MLHRHRNTLFRSFAQNAIAHHASGGSRRFDSVADELTGIHGSDNRTRGLRE